MSTFLAKSLVALGACLALAAGPSVFARGVGHGSGPRQSSGHSSHTASGSHASKSGGSSHSAGSKSNHTAHAGSGHAGGSKAAPGVKRDAHGKIARSAQAKDEFKKGHPCPATGKSSGSCPGYVIDHRVPLKRGGADRPDNMQWQTTAAAKAKDKTE